ncbi:hypothetical protein ACFQ58_04640 [Agromyces sp. NPDC056523]|uniref:hypothetical protein n=1 Tax=Agromyces sp. NPDC056523 TaxID=3345850 RepID=UPI00366AE1F8
MTASPSDPLVPASPTPPNAADPPSGPTSGGPPRAPDSARRVGWARAAAVVSLGLGVFAAFTLVTSPFRDPPTAIALAAVAVLAVVVGMLARRWSRRTGRPTSPMAITGIWLGAVSAFLGLVPTVLLAVLAERLEPEPPLTPAASARALDFEQRELEEAAALAATRLIRLVDDESSDALGSEEAGVYPIRLAVTTDGDVLLTTDGDVLVELPYDTRVRYETWRDAEHFELSLAGPLGGRAHVSDQEPTPAPPPTPAG